MKNPFKFKSIKREILFCVAALLAVSLIVVVGLVVTLEYINTAALLETTMEEKAELGADRIAKELDQYKAIAEDAGMMTRLASSTASLEDKQAIIDTRVQAYGLQRGNVIGLDGISIFDGNDYSDRAYFQESIQGKVAISEPLISKVTGELTIIISAPLWENGTPGTQVVGVVYFVPKETFLCDIMESLRPSETSTAFMLNSTGDLLAAPTLDEVKAGENRLEKAAAANGKGAQFYTDMCAGNLGKASYYDDEGVRRMTAYAPIPDTEGWNVGITVDKDEYMAGTTFCFYLSIALLAVSLAVGMLVSNYVINRITKPIVACSKRLELLAEGDLHSEVPTTLMKNEVGTLCSATSEIVDSLQGIIQDMDFGLQSLANGDLSIHVGEQFPGDLMQLRVSLVKIFYQLDDTLRRIHQTADQVSGGSEQVAAGAQALSQGATEQASSIQQLSATINEVSVKVKVNAKSALEAREKSQTNSVVISENNEQMQKMIAAMDDISAKSNQISKIIKSIDDIAFQTNILALNAAVEAARAGAAGKGFAVVADEVRNLAGKSAESAKSTAMLIADTVSAVNRGVEMANEAAQTMLQVVEESQNVTTLVEGIAQASNEQAEAISQVNLGVEQISSVVQTNSATAEESAAAAEELSSQAQVLNSLVKEFKLREEPRRTAVEAHPEKSAGSAARKKEKVSAGRSAAPAEEVPPADAQDYSSLDPQSKY